MYKKILKMAFVIFILNICIGFSLTTWKMFQFRDRLHGVIDNDRWEKTLSENGMYQDGLICFFGDSEIELWHMSTSFGSLPVVNRGVSGDWASKAINRFEDDVIKIKPRTLVLLIGTNDLGNGQSVDSIIDSIEYMVDMAVRHAMKVHLCSILPVRNIYTKNHPLEKIQLINKKLLEIAERYNSNYVDFFGELADHDGFFDVSLTDDGLHPNRNGYFRMTKILLPQLREF